MYTWNSHMKTVSKSDFRDAINLRIIDLSKNEIEVVLHSTFFWAIDLEFIDLSQNEIHLVQRNAFHGLIGLRMLYLQNNRIDLIEPGTFDLMPIVETIHLNHNALRSIDRNLFLNNPKLKSILLHDNQIKTISGTTFQHLRQLLHFDMHNNPTQGLDLLIVNADYTNIRNISCGGCYIGPKSKKLLASHNNISYIIQNGTGAVVEFDLSRNQLYSVENLTKFENLKMLDLSYNQIKDFDINTFANMTELESLKLRQSGLDRISYGSFSHKSKLKVLDISFNGLQTIDLNMLTAIIDLRSLYIDGNNLTEIDVSEIKLYFPALTTIGISENDWKCENLAAAIKVLESGHIELDPVGTVTQTPNIKGIPCSNESLVYMGGDALLAQLMELKYELINASHNLLRISNQLNAMLNNLKN